MTTKRLRDSSGRVFLDCNQLRHEVWSGRYSVVEGAEEPTGQTEQAAQEQAAREQAAREQAAQGAQTQQTQQTQQKQTQQKPQTKQHKAGDPLDGFVE